MLFLLFALSEFLIVCCKILIPIIGNIWSWELNNGFLGSIYSDTFILNCFKTHQICIRRILMWKSRPNTRHLFSTWHAVIGRGDSCEEWKESSPCWEGHDMDRKLSPAETNMKHDKLCGLFGTHSFLFLLYFLEPINNIYWGTTVTNKIWLNKKCKPGDEASNPGHPPQQSTFK